MIIYDNKISDHPNPKYKFNLNKIKIFYLILYWMYLISNQSHFFYNIYILIKLITLIFI